MMLTPTQGSPLPAADTANAFALLVPEEVWLLPQTRKALVDRDLTSLYRLARRYGYSQTRIAQAVGKSQPQVSEIMNAKVPHHASNVDVIHRHANAFRMPLHARMLLLGITASQIEQEAVRIDRRDELKRRELLRAAFALSATGAANWEDFSQSMIARMSDRDYLKWFAWELHLRRAMVANPASLPNDLAEWAVAEAAMPVPGFVCHDVHGGLKLVDDGLKDVLIAQTLSADIVLGISKRFTMVQTSHVTDRILERFVASDDQYETTLRRWMAESPDATLRVNSAGVLAKIQNSEGSEAALNQLGKDVAMREKYLTAVAHRVLGLNWSLAEKRVQSLESPAVWQNLPSVMLNKFIGALSEELASSTDGGARWCSTVLLSSFRSEYPSLVSEALCNALATETSTEILRVAGRSLAGKKVAE
ncbi:hypothetical protein AB0C27_50880 [Nonomuraea sp. NPDC048882]|uniref:hypothetical protein n=1 Tax=Nonomuraea sp. NPDC048882 TaxID=3154347 RepID=UPI0033C6BED6